MSIHSSVRFAALLAVSLLAGCGVRGTVPAAVPSATKIVGGSVMGGQQPVVGAQIQLYTVGTSGDGSSATPLLTVPVTTGAGGSFNVTGQYTCNNATQVYMTATGGNPGSATPNPNLSLMTALGSCSALTAGTNIVINELTTVAATAALAPYMTSASAVGSSSTDASALATAFALAQEFVDSATGTTPGSGVPAGMTVPTAQINTLGNVLAACINSAGGVAGDNSQCGQLFSLTAVNGTAPTDGIGALLNIARYPSQNVTAIYNLAPAASPFQPQLTAPPANLAVQLQPATVVFGVSSLSFSTTPTGASTAAQPVILSNIGSSSVALTSIGFGGAAPGDYAQSNNCPAMLARGASCTVQVSFAPYTAGTRNAQLVIGYANTSGSIALSGTAVAPSTGPVAISTSSMLFYDRTAAQTVTLTNNSASPLVISGINFSSANWTDTTTCGNVLSANSVCTVTVKPVDTPAQVSGTLTFTTGDTTDNQTVNLTTDAIYTKSYTFTPYSVPPVYYVGSRSTLDFSGGVYNGTYGEYDIRSGSPNGSDFASNSCVIHYLTTCSVTITFTPSAAGVRYAKVTTNAGEKFLFIGTGISVTQPTSSVSPAELRFAALAVGSQSASQDTTFNSSANYTSTSVFTQVNTYATGDFVVTAGCPTSNSSCTPSVAFKPTAVGTRTGVLTITGSVNTYSTTQTVQLYGQGIGGPTAPYTLPFGNVTVNTAATQIVTVVIPSQHAAIASISGSNSPFSLPGTFYCAAGAASCTVQVAFSPTATGSFTDTLVVTDTTTGYTSSTALSGTGGIPVAHPSVASLDFGLRNVGQTSTASSLTLTNTGNAPLVVSSVTIAGTAAVDYTQSNTCTTIAVGGACSIAVTNMPTATGARPATLTVTSNGAAVAIQLTSTGN